MTDWTTCRVVRDRDERLWMHERRVRQSSQPLPPDRREPSMNRDTETIPGWARAQAEAIRADELRRHEAGLDADLAYQAFAGEEALR